MRNTAPRRRNAAMYRNNYGYIRGSAAPVFPQETSYPHIDKTGAEHIKKRRVKKATVVNYVRVQEERNVYTLQILAIVSIIALLCIGVLSINAKISNVKTEIKQVSALTEKTRDVNERLKITLSQNTDIKEINRIATTRLGMQIAASHQIVNINVKKDSYSIQYDDKVADTNNRTFLEKIGLTKED